jgi:peptide/nickel transport system permease protein
MSEATQALPAEINKIVQRRARLSSLVRMLRFTIVRLLTLVLTIVVAVYLTVLIANMGGYVDNLRRAEIREAVQMSMMGDLTLREMTNEERMALMEERIAIEERTAGLDQPFILRSGAYLWRALTLNFGRAERLASDTGSAQVRLIILERLPATLLLFGTTNFILFFFEIFIALSLSRNYGSFWDKLFIALSPTNSAPGWFFGIFLILIFAALLKVLPFGGMVSAPPPDDKLGYILSLLEHMILPVSAISLSSMFIVTYNWRTFFLIYSSEDYVEVAKAKGLTSREIERRYIMRPTLPNIITNFAFVLMYSWTGAPIFESVFSWPGLGSVFIAAVNATDTPVIMASTVIFGYLLAITVFLLDFLYALVDPRVKVGGGEARS